MLNIISQREFLWDVDTEFINRYKENDHGGFQTSVPLPDLFASSKIKPIPGAEPELRVLNIISHRGFLRDVNTESSLTNTKKVTKVAFKQVFRLRI